MRSVRGNVKATDSEVGERILRQITSTGVPNSGHYFESAIIVVAAWTLARDRELHASGGVCCGVGNEV